VAHICLRLADVGLSLLIYPTRKNEKRRSRGVLLGVGVSPRIMYPKKAGATAVAPFNPTPRASGWPTTTISLPAAAVGLRTTLTQQADTGDPRNAIAVLAEALLRPQRIGLQGVHREVEVHPPKSRGWPTIAFSWQLWGSNNYTDLFHDDSIASTASAPPQSDPRRSAVVFSIHYPLLVTHA
jgi:hypothetical protein